MANPERPALLYVETREDLSRFLDVPLSTLTMFAFSRKDFYRHFSIPKKNGGERIVDAPKGKLKVIQRQIADALSEVYNPPKCVHGFTGKKSIVSNAQCHSGHNTVLNIDLYDFFPTITAARIHGLFSSKPFRFDASLVNMLTNIVCCNGHLPQGSPCSPVLSNMICLDLDSRIMRYCKQHSLFYTRYADDITISSNSKRAMKRVFKDDEGALDTRLVKAIEDAGFRINDNKTHVAFKGNRHSVTGIVVNKKCNFPREEYRSLRVMFHIWKHSGWRAAANAYVEHEMDRGSGRNLAFFDDELKGAGEERFVDHVRGRLVFYTMIDSANKVPSNSLIKLWYSFREVTGESVPVCSPDEVVYQTLAAYDAFDSQGLPVSFIETGSGFFLDDGRFFTCRHCVKDEGVDIVSSDDTFVRVFKREKDFTADVNTFDFIDGVDFASIVQDVSFLGFPGLKPNYEYLPQIGEKVRAIGYADAQSDCHDVIATIVSSRMEKSVFDVDRPYIAGMSGGPVLNRRGEVIGVILEGSKASEYFYDGAFLLLRSLKDKIDLDADKQIIALSGGE